MKRFMDLTTKAKLIFSFGIIILLFVLVVSLAYSGLRGITKSFTELHETHFKIALELRQLRSHQNFIRATMLDLLLIKDKSNQDSFERGIDERAKEIKIIIDTLQKLDPDPQFQIKMGELNRCILEYRSGRETELKLLHAGKIEKAIQLGSGAQSIVFEKVRSLATELGDNAETEITNQVTRDQQAAESSILLFIVICALSIIFSIVMTFLLNNTIAKPLDLITKTAQSIADGDLDVEVSEVDRKDEVGILSQTFTKMVSSLQNMTGIAKQIAAGNLTVSIVPRSEKDILGSAFLQMINNLRRITKEILESVNLLGSSGNEIMAATTQVASGAAETASAINETTTTVEEVRQAAQLSSQKATHVSENAQDVANVSQAGQKAVDDTVDGMHHIQDQMESIAQTVVRLSEQSQQIGGIIASVNDIADQSNLLAVNAAIEAAKAGEQGKGFSVVAQEIKSLALQSKQATAQVRNILMDIQKATSAAVMATEQGSKAVETGVEQSALAMESIKKLAESSNAAVKAASQIVASSQQQVVGMDQVGLAMKNISLASKENAASMVQSERAAKDLQELGQKMKQLVEQYKI